MTLDELIEQAVSLREKHGGGVRVVMGVNGYDTDYESTSAVLKYHEAGTEKGWKGGRQYVYKHPSYVEMALAESTDSEDWGPDHPEWIKGEDVTPEGLR